ncbi:MAG: beta-ketoacyl-[acyl-carrier-protein] synthase family protein [Lacipirellulaceae bacterium]
MILSLNTDDRVVVTGVGLVTALGVGRERTWDAFQRGESGVRQLPPSDDLPAGMIGATVDLPPDDYPGQTKHLPMCRRAAAEALADAGIDAQRARASTIGCLIGSHMGDLGYVAESRGIAAHVPAGYWPWWEQWMPSSACAQVGREFHLHGPRLVNATACASGTVALVQGVRAIQDGQCDAALVGAVESIHPLMASGFHNMRVLATADDPRCASRPFDSARSGFVMGEGCALLVVERLSHALARRVPIYAEFVAGSLLNAPHHITSIDDGAGAIPELVRRTLAKARLAPRDVQLVNAHGTGTQQNDVAESRGLRLALGRAADDVSVVANKSAIGHLVNAAGAAELALATLSLRDGFAPPTLNLTNPDPACDLDCTPLVGRDRQLEHVLKLSLAFGGHLAAVVLRRWEGRGERASLRVKPEAQRRVA